MVLPLLEYLGRLNNALIARSPKLIFINLFILIIIYLSIFIVHGVLRRRRRRRQHPPAADVGVIAASMRGDALPRRLRRLRVRRHARHAALRVHGQLPALAPQGGLLRPQEVAPLRRRRGEDRAAAAARDELQGEQKRRRGCPPDVAAPVVGRARRRRAGRPVGADDEAAAERRVGRRGREGVGRRAAGDDGCAQEGGAGEGGDRARRARADRAAAAVAVRQRTHGEGHGPRHLRRREQAVLHVAARGGAAQHPGGQAHRGAAAAPEAEAGQAASPAAPPARVVGAPRQAARRRHCRPRPRPLRRLHQPPLSCRRAGGPAVVARNRVLLRGHPEGDRSHHGHVLRHGRRDEQHAGRARADDPAGNGVPGGSHAAVEHRHELADAGAEPAGESNAGKAEA